MIDTFLEHRNEGFPRLRWHIMSAAERKAYQRDVAKARRAAKRAAEKALRNTMFWSEAAALLEALLVDNYPTFNTR